MAVTLLSNLWTPAIWIPGIAERVFERPSLITSRAVVRTPELDAIASGAGLTANIPFLRTPNHADEIQVENTAPSINNIASGSHICTILNRVSATGTTALAGGVSGADPLRHILDTAAGIRERQFNRTALSALRGVFGFNSVPAGAGALSALRNDIFLEAGAAPAAGQLVDSTKLLNTVYKLGEEVQTLAATGGVVVAHSAILNALIVQDQITFVRNSQGEFLYNSWKGMPVFVSDLLVRAGATSGFVYDTYILAPGALGFGAKPQSSNVGELASLLLDTSDIAKNNVTLYDRNRIIAHPMGTKWTGTPAGSSATNAELQTAANWTLAFSTAQLVGAVCLRSNG